VKTKEKMKNEEKPKKDDPENYLQVIAFFDFRLAGYDVTFYRKRSLGMTVCMVSNEQEIIVRGVAICSLKDQFSIKDGRAWAMKAASDAFTAKKNVRRIFIYKDTNDKWRYDIAYSMFGYHSCYYPYPTFEEQKILRAKRKEKE